MVIPLYIILDLLQSLVYLLVDKLFDAGLQLVHLPIDHPFNDLFLLEEILEVVEGKPRSFLLLFSLVHVDR